MGLRMLVVLLLALSLSGCVSCKKATKPSQDVSGLQAKVTALESALRDKDAAIGSLEDELNRLKEEKAQEAKREKASKASDDIK